MTATQNTPDLNALVQDLDTATKRANAEVILEQYRGGVISDKVAFMLISKLKDLVVPRKEYTRRTAEERADDARKELVLGDYRDFYSRIRDYGTAEQVQEARNSLAEIVKAHAIRKG